MTRKSRDQHTPRKVGRSPASRQAQRHYIDLRAGLLHSERDLDPAEYARQCRRLAKMAGV